MQCVSLAVAAVLFRPHDRDAAHDAPARLVAVEHECGEPLALVVGRLGDQYEVLRDAGAGDEPFAAVDHPFVAIPGCSGQHHRRVGTGAGRGFGHHDGRARLAIDDRLQPAFFLLLGRDFVQHRHVAVVGRCAVEDNRAEDRVVHFLVARGHADDVESLAAALFRHLRRPQSGRFGLDADRKSVV